MTLTKCKTAEDYRIFLAVNEYDGREREVIYRILDTLDAAEDMVDERVDALEKEVEKAEELAKDKLDNLHQVGELLGNMVDSIEDKEEKFTLKNVEEAIEFILDRFPDLIA